MSIQITATDPMIKAHIGKDDGCYWISFPDQDRACTLAYPTDIFWNSDAIGRVLEDVRQGELIAEIIALLEPQLNHL